MTSHGSLYRCRVAYGPSPEQFGDLSIPPGDGLRPVIVFVHGGFWRNRYDLSLAEPQVDDAVADGWAVFNVEYRRVGDPGGGFPGTLSDVARAVDHIAVVARTHPLDVGRVIVVGHSAGGHLALWVGQRARLPDDAGWDSPVVRPKLVVGQAPVCDLTAAAVEGLGNGAVAAMMGHGPAASPELYALADPSRLLPVDVPELIVHGSADDTVPLALSRSYQQRVASADVELVEFDGAGHFDVIDPAHRSWTLVKQRAAGI